MCIPPILAEASPEMGATFLMRKIPEPCNWRLIIWRESCATNGESELPPILTFLLTMKRMVVIDTDQELLPVSLSRMLRTTTMSAETRIHLPKAWEMMRWAEHSTKFPDHLLCAKLREGDFLGGSPIHVHHVQWSNRSCGACKPFQPKNGCALQEWGLDVQGVLIKFGTYGNEVIWWPKSWFYKFL